MTKPLEALTRRERKYLHPAIVFGWRIEIRRNSNAGLWDGDSLMPVKIGNMTESLIGRGYLERVSDIYIRATAKTKNLKCRAEGCVNGTLHVDDEPVGDCPHCDDGICKEVQQ